MKSTLRALALSFLVCAAASAQNAALLPVPRMQFLDANGYPLSGGLVYTCVAGSSCPGTPLASYTDASAGTANTNPVVLDAGGYGNIWLSSSSYKITLQSALGVTQWTQDNVTAGSLALSGSLAGASGSTLIKYTSAGTGAVSRTAASKFADIVSVKDFGAVGDGVTDETAHIQAAITYCLAKTQACSVYVPSGVYRINTQGGLTVTKADGKGFTFYGDGPHATQIIASTTALTSGAILNISAYNYAIVVRDMTISADTGANRNIDCIATTGNGQFFSRLWLAACNNGFHATNATNLLVEDSFSELNATGFNFDKTMASTLTGSATYQNTFAGVAVLNQVTLSGTATASAIEISNMEMDEDAFAGGNAALFINSNVKVIASNISVESNNNQVPGAAVFIDAGADTVQISNPHFSHTGNFGVYAAGGNNVSVTGGVMDRIGWYSTVGVPNGGYSATTMSAGVYAGSGINSLNVSGVTFRNVAGYGINSAASSNQVIGNYFSNWATGGSAGTSRNATTGLTAVQFVPSQSFWQGTLIGNQTALSASGSGLTAFALLPAVGITPALHSLQARNNTWASGVTPFTTTLSEASMRLLDSDLDGATTRFASALLSTTSGTNTAQINSTTGDSYMILSDNAAANPKQFIFQRRASDNIGLIFNQNSGSGYLPVAINPQGTAVTMIGTSTDNASSSLLQVGGAVSATGYKVGTTGGFTGSKVAGSCTLTISGGIITNVTGC